MSVRPLTSRVCRLFSCAFLAAICSQPAQADEPDRPQVTVESWVVEVSLADKSRHVGRKSVGDLLSTGVNPKLINPQLINPKFVSLADIGLTPGELVHELESKKLGRVLTSSKLRLPSGQSGSLQVNGTTIDATATIHGEKARLDYRFDITEVDPSLRDTVTGVPGYRQRMADVALELESAKGVMLPILPGPGTPRKTIAVIVQATFTAATDSKTESVRPNPAPAPDGGDATAAAKPAEAPSAVAIHLKVIQVNTAKLKNLGFAWAQTTADGSKELSVESMFPLTKDRQIPIEQFDGFLKALQQNSLARVLAEPTLFTLDGRPARLVIGPTQIDMVPILLGDGRAKLECRLKTEESREITADTELELGKMCLVRKSGMHDPRLHAQSPETEILILARVEILKPRELK